MAKRSGYAQVAACVMAAGVGFSLLIGATGCATTGKCSMCPCGQKEIKQMTNDAFYKDGKFDTAAAKQAYFDMFNRFGYPIFPSFKVDDGYFWVVDFCQGDFTKCGMGGVIFVNEKAEGYFVHDIFLLPNQAIAEHRHVATKDTDGKLIRCKMESWVVRNGSVYGFSEIGEPNLDKFPEAKAMLSAKQLPHLKSVHVEKWVPDGKSHKLPKDETWHFMLAGPEGAIVTEAATYHDGAGLRFSMPGVKF